MKRFFDLWKSYRQQVMPPTAGDTQVLECKRAFYAGAQAIMSLGDQMSVGDQVSDSDVDFLRHVHAELNEFSSKPFFEAQDEVMQAEQTLISAALKVFDWPEGVDPKPCFDRYREAAERLMELRATKS